MTLRTNFRGTTAVLALVAGQLLFANAASAQEIPSAQKAASEAGSESIIVTGSRIRHDPLQNEAPLVNIDRADIDRTGLSSIAQVLQRLPSAAGGLNGKNNASGNFGNPPDGGGVGAGSSEIDLRYLGAKRTLVLVDGLRFVPGSAASGIPASVDLNAIPEGMIERVEILQSGGSPVYGSDAIAGVVNIITKESQKGLNASAQVGKYFQGDGTAQDYELSYGAQGPSTSVVFGVSYVKQDPISSADRAISLYPNPYSNSCLDGGCSSATPNGRFLVNNPVGGDGLNLTLRQPVGGKPIFNPAFPADPNSSYKDFTTADRFNFAPYNYILTPSERYGGFFSAKQEFGDNINFRVKAMYNHRWSANQAAPLPLFVGPDAGNGNLLDTISIDGSNPFNPFGTLSAGGAGNPPANYSFIGRRVTENGPRHYEQTVDTMYLTGTLDGTFQLGSKKFYWDASAVYGENSATQVFTGNINAAKLAKALGPVSQCTGDCVPFNIFGGEGTITPAMLGYVAFTQHDQSSQTLSDYTLNVSGDLFNLPAGAVGIAAGYEHRKQSASFSPDPVIAAGLGSDIPALPSSGSYYVNELYAELRVPLIKEKPGFYSLEATGALRYSDYSTFGSTTTWDAGVSWQPVADLLLRGAYSQGFRAPSIGELYGTPSRFDQALDDPCSDINHSGVSATVRANCIASGVPSNGSYVQPNPQISVVTGGNIDLQPETSRDWVFGAVYSPAWARERGFGSLLNFEINYYNIQLAGAISAIGADVLINRCADTLDALSCAAVKRTANGNVAQINGLLQNIGGINTQGIDFNFNYRSNPTSAGTFGFSWTSTFLLQYEEIVPATNGSTTIGRKGTERGSPDQTYPAFKAYATIDWSLQDFAASVTGRYISSVTESQNDNVLGSRFYTDIQIVWTPSSLKQRWSLAFGVNNLFNVAPPGCISCGLNNFDPTTYDVPGQYGYLRLAYKM